MKQIQIPILFFLFLSFFCFGYSAFPAPKGKTTGVTFDRALPEDISNENFPDRIESFDFPNASLLDLVKAISKLTGVNFMIDPALQGKRISIIAPSPITVAEAYKVFLSALAANGYTIVKSGAFWKIQTIEKSHKDNTEVYSGDYYPNTDQLITRIIKLKHTDATNFMTSIKWLLSQDNQNSVLESSNSIILSDYGSVIEKIMKIVYETDVPGSEENIQIIKIVHASAEDLALMLEDLLSIKSKRRGSYISRSMGKKRISLSPSAKTKTSAGNLKISSIIPDSRTNSLVISANKEGMQRVHDLVNKLDIPVDVGRTGGVYVYNVLYGTAEEVYNTLMGIKPSESGKSRSSQFGAGFPALSRGSSRSSASSSQSPLFENVTIMADNNTNSLIISAKNKYNYERVKAVLKRIDVPRDQVFIQAIIVEMIVSKGDSREFNLPMTLGAVFKDSLDKLPFFTELGLGSSIIGGFLHQALDVESLQKSKFGPGFALGLPFKTLLENLSGGQISPQVGGLPSGFEEKYKALPEELQAEVLTDAMGHYMRSPVNQAISSSIFPLLRLLKEATNVNVLSTPQLTALDNVPAFIEVGENAPVGLISTATAGALSQNSVDRKDITLRLDIVPRINPESGTIQMDIKQKFDDFSNRSSSASELASRGVHIIKRNIQTKMVLNDGETAVLGGLLTDKETQLENKVPILGDIPVLGWLFKGTTVKKEKRNLLVFITPTIVKGDKQKEKTKEILGKKLEERIHFVKKYMKGRDPHGENLKRLIPGSESILDDKKPKKKSRKWFWQKKPDKNLSDQGSEETEEESSGEDFNSQDSNEFDEDGGSFLEEEEEYEEEEEDEKPDREGSRMDFLEEGYPLDLEKERGEKKGNSTSDQGLGLEEMSPHAPEEGMDHSLQEDNTKAEKDDKDKESEEGGDLNREEILDNKGGGFIPMPPEEFGL